MLYLGSGVSCYYDSIWKSFVPFHSYQVFQRGAYYSVEVIPDALAVISLNTMYFFASNKGQWCLLVVDT